MSKDKNGVIEVFKLLSDPEYWKAIYSQDKDYEPTDIQKNVMKKLAAFYKEKLDKNLKDE